MAGEWHFELRARHSPEQRCAICHGDIGASAMACVRCQTAYHEDCVGDTGRCPTLGCTARPATTVSARLAEHARRTFEETPRRRPWARWLLWPRLLVRVGVFTALACVFLWLAVGAGLLAIASGPFALVVVPLGLLCLWLVRVSFTAIGDERRLQNEVRVLLRRGQPVLVHAWPSRSPQGSWRTDLRAVGALPTDPVELAVQHDRARLAGWVRNVTPGSPLLVHGLSGRGAAILEAPDGRQQFVPERAIERAVYRRVRRR